jgi:hypothetical protein
MNLMKKLAIMVFVCGAAVLGLAHAQKGLGKKAPEGFVMTYITRRVTQDANNGRNELAVRMVGANGRWKETRWRDTGKTETVSDGTSVYKYSEKKATLDYAGPEGKGEPPREIPKYASSTGMMLGVKVYTVRNEQGDGSYIENTYSLETGVHCLKMVVYIARSGETTTVEAVSLQFRPVKDEELALPNLPGSFTNAERELEEMRNSGNDVDYLEEGIKAAKAEAAKKQR